MTASPTHFEHSTCRNETPASGPERGAPFWSAVKTKAGRLPRWCGSLFALGLVTTAAAHSAAADPTVRECLDTHTRAQEMRLSGRLLESREEMNRCALEICPDQISADCLSWLDELRQQIPTVVFEVTADGVTRADVRVSVDGKLVMDRLNGRAVELDPGPHTLRFELSPFAPIEREVLVKEGDKLQIISVRFSSTREPAPAPAPPRPVPPPVPVAPLPTPLDPPPVPTVRPIPVATYMFLGAGAAAAASGVAWGLASKSLRDEMDGRCVPDCSADNINALRQRAMLTDLSWGLSALSFASAAVLYLTRPEYAIEDRGPEGAALDVHLGWLPEGGAFGGVSRPF